jgi:hypothetical protein
VRVFGLSGRIVARRARRPGGRARLRSRVAARCSAPAITQRISSGVGRPFHRALSWQNPLFYIRIITVPRHAWMDFSTRCFGVKHETFGATTGQIPDHTIQNCFSAASMSAREWTGRERDDHCEPASIPRSWREMLTL